ncbi:hypothetical protein AB0J38_00165 [Streptomyces sp. NPDC050095]|uniref:hypothetical protein n=1 Tax=unclassified Streptomyces TaxID=2593676 RepID=UPI00342683AD
MPNTDSRVRRGSLKLTLAGSDAGDVLDVSCQPTNVTLTPDTDEGDSQEVLCGDVLSTGGATSWTLDVTSIQDFDNAQGFTLWALENEGKSATFEWKPNDVSGSPTFTGTVTVRAMAIGGDVATQNTSDVSWPITSGKPQIKPASAPESAPAADAGRKAA